MFVNIGFGNFINQIRLYLSAEQILQPDEAYGQ